MDINTYLQELKERFNYSDELLNFIGKSIPFMIQYYGQDKKDLILNCFRNVKIHIEEENENIKDYLNDYFGVDKEWEIPALAAALCDTMVKKTENSLESKTIIYVNRHFFGIYKPFDFSNEENQSTLIHEMCHAVKGYGREFKLQDKQIIAYQGLIEDIYEYDSNSKMYNKVQSNNVGIEEALNSYDEAQIMTLMTGKECEPNGYKAMMPASKKLMSFPKLAKAIRISQFENPKEWIKLIGKENSEALISGFDDWVSSMYVSIQDIMNNPDEIDSKRDRGIEKIRKFTSTYEERNDNSINNIVLHQQEGLPEEKRIKIQKIVYLMKVLASKERALNEKQIELGQHGKDKALLDKDIEEKRPDERS